ncbi:MAG: ABC transporter ATP-binding protein [Spirochaetales bacterium]|nr:MAG: ABC transporter ATP-binding protein [Spirochaetales bacterium]
METEVISADHVFKSYGSLKALDDLSFKVSGSECFALLGPNGAGKTTMMKILYGKAVPDNNAETRLSVFGYDPRKNELAIKNCSGVVPQDNNLDEELNIFQNLFIFSKFYKIPSKEAETRIEELLDFMELKEKKKSKIRELSGGMKRRLVIARALLNRPKLLILDEPTTGLDPQVRHLIWDKLLGLKRSGVTIMLTTHYMEEAFQIADKLIIMDQGKSLMYGSPKALLASEIETHVLELSRKSAEDKLRDIIERDGNGNRIRKEESMERVLYYSSHTELLKSLADNLSAGDWYIRQSNLEDLFLKATGRRIHEAQ